jgi:hypothetical protein
VLYNLQQTTTPLPNEMIYLFRAGVRAALYRENNLQQGMQMYGEWEETLTKALRAADRQAEDFSFVPTSSIMGGGYGAMNAPQNIGAAWPFSSSPMGF